MINGSAGAEAERRDDEKKDKKSSESIPDGSYVALDVVQTKPNKTTKKATRPERTPLARKIQALNLWLGEMGVVVASLIFIVLCTRFSIATFEQEPRQAWDASYLRDYLSYFILGTTTLVVAIPKGPPLHRTGPRCTSYAAWS